MHENPHPLAPHYPSPPPYYHGTRAQLAVGDLIQPGHVTNHHLDRKANFVYFSATLEAAMWGAELAQSGGRERIYIVEPTGPYTDDPNLTDKKFPGNPTKSYRSACPLRIIGEVVDWVGHSPEQLQKMREGIARLKAEGQNWVDD